MEKTTITLEIPADIIVLCDVFDIKPEQLLSTFMADLCSMSGSQGSDERMMAKIYFLRGGISHRHQWHIEHAEDLITDFDHMRRANYPAISNTGYDEKRKEQLKEWHAEAITTRERANK